MPSNGRPLKPPDPDAPVAAARFAAELRGWRLERGLTQAGLAAKVGCMAQHVSELERARVAASARFALACDLALGTDGALAALQPAVVLERAAQRERRAAARTDPAAALRYEDVDPTNRRGVLSTAAGAALGTAMVGPAPARAREIDPALVDHWTDLLNLLGQHNQAFGPRLVRDAVRRELRLIAEHRAAACGELRVALMGVEACWSEFGSWLAHDCGDRRERDALLNRALYLAREAGYPDVLAWVHARLADWSDAPVALRHAEAGLRTAGAGAHARAMCATRVAYAHACTGAAEAAERSIAEAERLAAEDSRPLPPPSSGMTALLVRRWEANCWAVLKPARAIELYDAILRDQPRAWVGGHGLYLAYLANACADAGELDRARAEGGRALAIAKQTKSTTAARELKRLQAALKAA